ncbi:hypothetical protein ACFXTO_035305 [Malus domestica]
MRDFSSYRILAGRAIVGNSIQRAKSTEGIADHDEHLGNAVEKTEGLRFWGRTIACDGEINGGRRFDACTMTSDSRIEVVARGLR